MCFRLYTFGIIPLWRRLCGRCLNGAGNAGHDGNGSRPFFVLNAMPNGMEPLQEAWDVLSSYPYNQSSLIKTGVSWDHLDVLTAEIKPGIVLSTIKAGIRPPGILDVAMRHSVFPLGSSLTLSTLA